MVVIRLSRGGAKKRPFYRITVADKRYSRDGRFIERLGYYNPVASGNEAPLFVNIERVEYWKSVGAQPSERVESLIEQFKTGKVKKPKKKKKKIVEAKPAEEATAEEAVTEEPAVEEATAEPAPKQVEEEAPAEETPADKTTE